MGDLFGGGDSKTTTETKFSKPVQQAQNALVSGANKGILPYLNDPSAYVAPLNSSQEAFGAGANNLVGYNAGSNMAGSLPDYASRYSGLMGSVNPQSGAQNPNALAPFVGSSGAGGLDRFLGGSGAGSIDQFIPGYSERAIGASTIDQGDIDAFANPLRDEMMGVDARQRGDAYQQGQRDIGARAAAGGAFGGGGSGEFLERAMGARDYQRDSADAATKIAYDSYGQGAALAQGNAAAETAALQSAGNDIYGRAMGAASYDASEANNLFNRAQAAAAYDTGQTDSLFNRAQASAAYGGGVTNDAFSRALSAGNFDLSALSGASGYDVSRGTFNNGSANDYTSRLTSSLGLLGAYGDLQRGVTQQTGDRAYTQFSRLAPLIPGITGQQSTTAPSKSPGIGQSLLGTALAVGGAPVAGGGSLFGSWLG